MAERDDSQLIRMAQDTLERLAVTFYAKAKERGVSAKSSEYAAGWADAMRWAGQQAEDRAKAMR